jgi:hypothetical protein
MTTQWESLPQFTFSPTTVMRKAPSDRIAIWFGALYIKTHSGLRLSLSSSSRNALTSFVLLPSTASRDFKQIRNESKQGTTVSIFRYPDTFAVLV